MAMLLAIFWYQKFGGTSSPLPPGGEKVLAEIYVNFDISKNIENFEFAI